MSNYLKPEDELEETTIQHEPIPSPVEPAETSSAGAARYRELSLKDLIKLLPDSLSYSPIRIPLTSAPPLTLLRRDLYDARFQVMNENDDKSLSSPTGAEGPEDDDDEKYVDGETDLVPGKYEGGLKTWEGGADLVQVLAEYEAEVGGLAEAIYGKKVLEVGCGTALPTAYLLHLLSLSPPPPTPTKTTFHLQDYNLSVLHLVTLPNLLLSILPASYLDEEMLELDEETIDAALEVLEKRGVELKFSCGGWEGMKVAVKEEVGGWDLVLTAETIYRMDSVESLIGVLKGASKPRSLTTTNSTALDFTHPENTLILVAAKILYFGVGGGLSDFADRIAKHGGRLEEVKSWEVGVGRRVVRVCWE